MLSVEIFVAIVLFILLVAALVVVGLLGFVLFNTKQQLSRFENIINLEAEQDKVKSRTKKLQQNNKRLKSQQVELKQEVEKTKGTIAQLNSEIGSLEDEIDLQSYGLYEPKYDFERAEIYRSKIDELRKRQKEMVRDKTAVICGTEWTVQGSKTKGRKMTNDQIRLMLRAFNGECDSTIIKVKYNNVKRIEERIQKTFDAINKLGKPNNCWITGQYLDLKIEELHLVHEYQEKLQAEKEEQRQIREQIREEQRAQRELEKAQQNAQKEEERYEKALIQARKEIEKATGNKQVKLQEKIEQLQLSLKEAHEKKERAISRAQMTRSGHVYIISNIGSFGEDVYKIGLTRRLEPMDRVKELGDASVPFPFDVHAMIFSEDAPALETELHNSFDSRRVNRINPRKEFFKVRLDEIKNVVCQNNGEIQFTMKAEAEEYRKSQAVNAGQRTA